MNKLNIVLSSNSVETVTAQIIDQLYNAALSVSEPEEGETDLAYVSGHISIPVTYKLYVDYLAGTIGEGTSGIVTNVRLNSGGRFLDLQIDITNGYSIAFEDQNMLLYLLNKGIGSNGHITTADTIGVTTVVDDENTTITKFNELKYFTSITGSKGGWSGNTSGSIKFKNWTALEEVDISNFTSLGHDGYYGNEDTFSGCTNLKTVIASNNLDKIGYLAFNDCYNLEEITGLNGTIELRYRAFGGCKKLKQSTIENCLFLVNSSGYDSNGVFLDCYLLTSITLAQGTPKITIDMFRSCSALRTVSIPNSVTSLYREAFRDCTSLTSVDISSVTTIDGYAHFRACSSLVTVVLPSTITELYDQMFNGCTSLTNINIPNNLTRIGEYALSGCSNLSFDASILGNVTYFSRWCFDGVNITGALVLNSAATFHSDGGAFSRTSISSADLSNTTLLSVPLYTFRNNNTLTTVVLPSTVTSLGQDVFINDEHLSSINLGNVTSIGKQCFSNCKALTSIDLSSIQTIGERAFDTCSSLATCTGLSSVVSIGPNAFIRTGLTGDISLSNLTSIDGNAFSACKNLTSVDFTGSTFTSTGSQLFSECTNLDHVIWPTTLTSAAMEMYKLCNNMRYVKFLSTTVPTNNSTFNYNNTNFKIYVPDAAVNDYKADSGWSSYSSRIFPMSQFATDFPNG